MSYKGARVLPQQRVSNFDTAALKRRIKQAKWKQGHRADGTFKPSKRHKYNAKGRWCDGHFFPSKAEADRYDQLVEMQKLGTIAELEIQPRFPIVVNGVMICIYIADFQYRIKPHKLGSRVLIEDVKGVHTQVYVVKRKLVEVLYPFKIFELHVPKNGGVARYRYVTADQFAGLPKEEEHDGPMAGRADRETGAEGGDARGPAAGGGEGDGPGEGQPDQGLATEAERVGVGEGKISRGRRGKGKGEVH